MTRNRIRRRDYATGLSGIVLLAIVLLPVGGVIVLGLLTPFIIAGLLIMAAISLFTRGLR